MTQSVLRLILAALALHLVGSTARADDACSSAAISPLARAHAHNDYEHERPLFDALEQGFTSVEADIWLVDGQLLVAHDLENVQPGRTIEALYLEPLAALVRANGGVVHPCFRHSLQLWSTLSRKGRRPTARSMKSWNATPTS